MYCLYAVIWCIVQDLISIKSKGIQKHFKEIINSLDLTFYIIFLVYFKIRMDSPQQIIVPTSL